MIRTIYLIMFLLVGNLANPSLLSRIQDKCDCELSYSNISDFQQIDYVCCEDEEEFENLMNQINSSILIDQFWIYKIDPSPIFRRLLNINEIFLFNITIEGFVSVTKNPHIRKITIKDFQTREDFLHEIQFNLPSLEMIYLENYNHSHYYFNRNDIHLFSKPFDANSKLKSLIMINCRIKSLKGVDLLKKVKTLKLLSLAWNNITAIDNVNFLPPQNSEQFEHLDISGNKLNEFPDTWKFPASTTKIHLEKNNISVLPQNLFRLENLQELWLQENHIDCQDVEERFGDLIPDIFICPKNKRTTTITSTTITKNPDTTTTTFTFTSTPITSTEYVTTTSTTETPITSTEYATTTSTTDTTNPTTHTPQPTTDSPHPTTYTPQPTTDSPHPTTYTPQPTTDSSQPTTHTPRPTASTQGTTAPTPEPSTEPPTTNAKTTQLSIN